MTPNGDSPRRGVCRILNPQEPPVRCAVTSVLLKPGSEVVQCDSCGRFHHPDGWMCNGGCATNGCRSAPRISSVGPPPPPRQSPPSPPPARSSLSVSPPPPASSMRQPPAPPPAPRRPAPPPPPPIVAGANAKGAASEPLIIRITLSEARTRCPFTLDTLLEGQHAAKCPSCGQLMSLEGWHENHGCSTYGCERAPDYRKDQI
jgi:hypothetical protein